MKKLIIMIMLISLMTLVACKSDEKTSNNSMENEQNQYNEKQENNRDESSEENVMAEEEKIVMDEKTFNKDSLAAFNGKDGQPAYVAVDGIVYNVTGVAAWQSPHAGRFEPGKDYSKEINQSPHGKKNLEGLEVIGIYEE
jgi:predicted heme/steroid binding protein